MRIFPQSLAFYAVLCSMLWFGSSHAASAAVLTHRYSFAGNGDDSVGGANGNLQGNAKIESGALVLDGTNSCLRLPEDLFTNDNSVSFEMWFVLGTLTSPDARLYSFRGTNGAMALELDGQGYYVSDTGSNVVSLPTPAVADTVHVVWTQDSAAHTARLYVNGALASENINFTLTPVEIGSTTNDWLGRSQFPDDPYFSGNYDEFRIYRGLLSDSDVAADYAAGPNVVGVDYVLHDSVSSNQLTLTWGLSATNWFLESSPALGADAVWSRVSADPTVQNGRYHVTVPISSKAGYFRLHAP